MQRMECERARALDPSVKLHSSALNAYLYLGQYEKFLKSLPDDSESPLILFYRGFGEYYLRRFDDAVEHIGRAAVTSGRLGFVQTEAYQVTSLGRALCQAGDYEAGAAALAATIAEGAANIADKTAKVAAAGIGGPLAVAKAQADLAEATAKAASDTAAAMSSSG